MKKAAKSKEVKKVVSEQYKVDCFHIQPKTEEVSENTEQKDSLFERALGKGKNYTVMTESASAISDKLRKVKTGKYDSTCIHKIK